MAQFCIKCGAQIPEGTTGCQSCGADSSTPKSVENPTAKAGTTYQQPVNATISQATPLPSKKNKLIGIGIGIVAVVVIIFIALISGIFGGEEKKPTDDIMKPINAMIKALEKCDADAYLAVYPEDMGDMLENYFDDDYLDDMMDDLEDEYGKNIKISAKLTDKKKMDKDDIEDIEDEYDNYCDVKIKIKEAYEVECDITIKGKDDKDTDSTDFIVIKVGSKWYLYEGGF